MKWIRNLYTHNLFSLTHPTHLPHPSPLGHYRAPSWAPCSRQQLPTSHVYFAHDRVDKKVNMLVAQPCPILWDPMDGSPAASSVHGILPARILVCVVIPFSRGSSQPKDRTHFSCIAGECSAVWAARKANSVHMSVLIHSACRTPFLPLCPLVCFLCLCQIPALQIGLPVTFF